MKLHAALLTLLFTMTPSAFAQCPTITVSGPAGVTEPGYTMSFRASIDVVGPKFEYKWMVNTGTIVEGQGTPTISVAVDRSIGGYNVTATVEVLGLAADCPRTASETSPVAPRLIGDPVDDYGILKANDERSRLDSFFTELANNPHHIGLIVLNGPDAQPHRRNPRIRLVLDHVRLRDFDVERIWFALEKSPYRRTVLWRVPPGAELPCENCRFVKGGDLNRASKK